MMMGFSAADLIKRSARQILYLRQHPEKKQVTLQQLQGVEDQKRHTTSPFVEMRGTFTRGSIAIYFSVDEVQIKRNSAVLIEHKSGNLTERYFQKSVIQTGAYEALLRSSDFQLETATFYQKMGNIRHELDLEGKKITSRLLFLGELFSMLRLQLLYCMRKHVLL